MHDPIETGKTIERLRKQAGYTQKTLADALFITDKAVSKWERGLASPNISLLPKLSALLDADMGALLSGILTAYTYNWKGVLVLSESVIPFNNLVYDKPMVYYLISNFLLVGIKDILIIGFKKNLDEIQSVLGNGELIGISITYIKKDIGLKNVVSNYRDYFFESNLFLNTGNYFYFGASLSRQLQGLMSSTNEIIGVSQNSGQQLPMFFIPQECSKKLFIDIKNEDQDFQTIIKPDIHEKRLSRGIIAIPFETYENINDISTFVGFFQRNHGQKICDVFEISRSRGLIK